MEADPRANQGAQNVSVSVAEFSVRYQSKKECYAFLTQALKSYQAPANCVTIWHLKDQISGVKGYVKCTEMQHLYVPQYEGLSTDDILAWTKEQFPGIIDRFLPSPREYMRFPRQVSIAFRSSFMPNIVGCSGSTATDLPQVAQAVQQSGETPSSGVAQAAEVGALNRPSFPC